MVSLQSLGLPEQEPPVQRVDVEQPLRLATSSYQNWREDSEYLPVGITTGRPRFVRYQYLTIKALAPWELMRGPLKGIDDIPIERRVYRERLRVHEDEILAALHEIAQVHPGAPAVLMCFEAVAEKGEACHRRWFAEWAHERYGWDVPELAANGGAVRPADAKPKAPDATLF